MNISLLLLLVVLVCEVGTSSSGTSYADSADYGEEVSLDPEQLCSVEQRNHKIKTREIYSSKREKDILLPCMCTNPHAHTRVWNPTLCRTDSNITVSLVQRLYACQRSRHGTVIPLLLSPSPPSVILLSFSASFSSPGGRVYVRRERRRSIHG